jgi:hypothetical protein
VQRGKSSHDRKSQSPNINKNRLSYHTIGCAYKIADKVTPCLYWRGRDVPLKVYL